MSLKNPNCDGEHCNGSPVVRKLPTGGGSNAILCHSCFIHEIRFRKERNLQLGADAQFDLPKWTDLELYNQ